jgi:hypothetical protein
VPDAGQQSDSRTESEGVGQRRAIPPNAASEDTTERRTNQPGDVVGLTVERIRRH